MALVNLTDASKLASVTRPTIYKAIKKGTLSAERAPDGSGWLIDTAELMRVYRNIQLSVNEDALIDVKDLGDLQREIELLQLKLLAKDEVLQARDLIIAQQGEHIKDLQRLIEHRPVEPSKKGFFRRLFGG